LPYGLGNTFCWAEDAFTEASALTTPGLKCDLTSTMAGSPVAYATDTQPVFRGLYARDIDSNGFTNNGFILYTQRALDELAKFAMSERAPGRMGPRCTRGWARGGEGVGSGVASKRWRRQGRQPARCWWTEGPPAKALPQGRPSLCSSPILSCQLFNSPNIHTHAHAHTHSLSPRLQPRGPQGRTGRVVLHG
jgi:hypothetical protein